MGWRNSVGGRGQWEGKGKGEERGKSWGEGKCWAFRILRIYFDCAVRPVLLPLIVVFILNQKKMAGNIFKITKSGKVKNVHPVWIQSEAVTSLPHLKRRPISQGQKLDKTKVELIYFYFFPVLHLDRHWEEFLEEI